MPSQRRALEGTGKQPAYNRRTRKPRQTERKTEAPAHTNRAQSRQDARPRYAQRAYGRTIGEGKIKVGTVLVRDVLPQTPKWRILSSNCGNMSRFFQTAPGREGAELPAGTYMPRRRTSSSRPSEILGTPRETAGVPRARDSIKRNGKPGPTPERPFPSCLSPPSVRLSSCPPA